MFDKTVVPTGSKTLVTLQMSRYTNGHAGPHSLGFFVIKDILFLVHRNNTDIFFAAGIFEYK